MAHGVRSGIMSLTVSALLTCYRSRFQTWILPLPLHYRGAESAPDARRLATAAGRTMSFSRLLPTGFPQHYTAIDPQSVVYGPSVIYMVSELIRQWSETGEGVVIHTPAYDAFYKAIEGNQRTVMPVALEKQADGWFCDMGKLEAVLAKPECKIMLLCSPQNPTGKVWTCDELEIMADLCERHGVRVISDEIHMDMVWGEQPHDSTE